MLRELRSGGCRTPVLLLTAKAEVEDRILGLDMGADDYLPKPFAMGELLARVRAMLQDLTARHRGGRVLVATHGGVQQAVFTIVEQRPLRRMWDDFLGNCGCVAVGVQGSAMRVLRVFPAVQMPQE